MRPSMPVLMISVLMAGVWAQASAPPAPRVEAYAGPIAETMLTGLAARLAEAGAVPLPDMMAGPDDDGLWRVRGRTPHPAGPAAGLPAAFHATLRPVCGADWNRAACWRLERLSVGGVAVDLPVVAAEARR